MSCPKIIDVFTRSLHITVVTQGAHFFGSNLCHLHYPHRFCPKIVWHSNCQLFTAVPKIQSIHINPYNPPKTKMTMEHPPWLKMYIFYWGGFFFVFFFAWSPGPLSPPVLWSSGPLVPWSPGPPVLWSSGPLVLWSSSSTSSTSSSSRMWKQKTYWRILNYDLKFSYLRIWT